MPSLGCVSYEPLPCWRERRIGCTRAFGLCSCPTLFKAFFAVRRHAIRNRAGRAIGVAWDVCWPIAVADATVVGADGLFIAVFMQEPVIETFVVRRHAIGHEMQSPAKLRVVHDDIARLTCSFHADAHRRFMRRRADMPVQHGMSDSGISARICSSSMLRAVATPQNAVPWVGSPWRNARHQRLRLDDHFREKISNQSHTRRTFDIGMHDQP